MGPLDGIKIVDLTTMVSGPVATMMLCDQGADVIKVEALTGEQMRHIGPPHNGVASAFFSCNRGKRSLALDLKTEEGKAVLRKLIAETDVLIQNFRPGAMARMGFPDEVISDLNDNLIYVSISGFGEKGPYADNRVYDPVIQALSTATDIQMDRKTGRPQMFRIIVADKVTALTTAQAVTAALFHRERTGQGQQIKVSMLDAMLSFFWPEGMAGLVYGEMEFDVTRFQGKMDLIYESQDGYITAGAVSDAEWAGLCRAIKREDLIEDERFATSSARFVNGETRKEMTAVEIAKFTSEDILARLNAEDVPCAALLTRMELLDHEQIQANDSVQIFDLPGFGEVRQAGPAARFEVTPTHIQSPAPRLGEHSQAILSDIGYSHADIAGLAEAGIIKTL